MLSALLRLAFRLALALPWLAVAAVLAAALAVPARAEDRDCGGTSLVPTLQAGGEYAAAQALAAAVPNGEGKLFRIEKPGVAPSHLFGTIHLTDPAVLALPAPAETAFADARRLVIETLDVVDPKKALAALLVDPGLTTLPPGTRLGALLKPEDKTRLEAALREKGIPFQAVETMQPWFLSVSLTAPACEAARQADGARVLDAALALRAGEAGKPVEGLESAAEQLRALASMPQDAQIEALIVGLENADRLPDLLATMVQLWQEGRIALIMPLLEKAFPDGALLVGAGEGAPAFEKAVIDDRNINMATRMEGALEKGGAFVAVGALHLPGEKGLVALLRTAGWTVTRAD